MNAIFGAWLFVPVISEIIDAVALTLKNEWRNQLKLTNMNDEEIDKEVERKYA